VSRYSASDFTVGQLWAVNYAEGGYDVVDGDVVDSVVTKIDPPLIFFTPVDDERYRVREPEIEDDDPEGICFWLRELNSAEPHDNAE